MVSADYQHASEMTSGEFLFVLTALSGMLENEIAVLLSLHTANSYILLTANLDDVHSLAKQLASSPVVNQLQEIIRHATTIFNEHQEKHDKAQMRADPILDKESPQKSQPNPTDIQAPTKKPDAASASDKNNVEVWIPDEKALAAEMNAKMSDSSSATSGEANAVRPKPQRGVRRTDPDLAELGRNAGFYLNSIKKIFESV